MTDGLRSHLELGWWNAELGMGLDPSAMPLDLGLIAQWAPAFDRVFTEMTALEAGAVANPDEGRMVGHYWLRNSALAPNPEFAAAIDETRDRVVSFAKAVVEGEIRSPEGARFTHVLCVGIGGSALGPQFVGRALAGPCPPLQLVFLDNTDPQGFDDVMGGLGPHLDSTLVLVISKSGSTPETRNGMLEVRRSMEARGRDFSGRAVAVTGVGSQLDQLAREQGWLARFPMWDWVGGRTSQTSAVGLLPAALQGIDVVRFLAGAATMDAITRQRDLRSNPAALLALCWHVGSAGRGARDLVILPYKDSLELLARYLQQLIMESLGKRLNLRGEEVHQGLAVYGNKGSTDQHAFVQQLREGVPNFFVQFVEVLKERNGERWEVEPGVTAGDYLGGLLQGTRQALRDAGRWSYTITLAEVTAQSLGALIALHERAVGFYATLVGVNAYHQPGVEAGKTAAAAVLKSQGALVAKLRASTEPRSAEDLGHLAGVDPVVAFQILRRLSQNDPRVRRSGDPAEPASWTFAYVD